LPIDGKQGRVLMDIAAIIARFEDHEKRIAACETLGADHEKRIVITEKAQDAMSNLIALQEDIQDLVGLLKQGRALFSFASIIGRCIAWVARSLAWVARSLREIALTVAAGVALYYLVYKHDFSTFTNLLSAVGR
jgi:hypothetical protein